MFSWKAILWGWLSASLNSRLLLDSGTPDDGNYAMELWYSFQVTDNITVAPGIYWLSNPAGELSSADDSMGIFGGVVQTRFKF